jgi:hypothetical protein
MSVLRKLSPGLVAAATACALVAAGSLATTATAETNRSPGGTGLRSLEPLTAAWGPQPAASAGPLPPAPTGPLLPPALRTAPAVPAGLRKATPPVATAPAGPDRTAALGRAALAQLGYDVASTGFRVEFRPGREGLLGETFLDRRVIRIYVRPGQTVPQVVRILAHEVGHALDISSMTTRSRQRWLAARGAAGTPWWPGQDRSDFASGAGDFAEVFARWLLGEQMRFRSTVAPAPTEQQLAELARTFFRPQARRS